MTFKIPAFSRHPVVGGALGYGVLNLLLFGDLFWIGKNHVLSSPQADLYLHFVAWRQFAFEQLRQGHLVLWNPHYLCGAPFFGGFEAALLYPLNWIYLILPLGPALNLGIVLHVFLAGFFTYLWALHRGQQPLAAFMAGTIFMWGGAYFLHLFAGHLPNLCTMVWAPLIFLSVDGLIERKSARWVGLGIFAVSMQILAGHPQYVYFTAIIVGIYFLFHLKDSGHPWELAGSLFAVYGGAALLTAIQLWTGFEAFTECGRNIPLEFDSAKSFSFPPENILTLFLPGFFGNLSTAPYWGRWYLWEVSLYIGIVGLFLVIVGVVSGADSKKWKLLIVAGMAFLFSLGAFSPLYRFFYEVVPFFQGFRGICKFDYLTALLLALLAGMGMDQILRQKKIPRWMVLFSLSTGVTLAAGGTFIYVSAQSTAGYWNGWFSTVHWLQKNLALMGDAQRQTYVLQAGRQSARALWIGGGTFLAVALLLKLPIENAQRAFALTALCLLELFLFARANRPTFDLAGLEKKFEIVRDFYSENPGEYRVYGTGSASLVTGLDDIWEDEPMVLGRYGRFVCRSQNLSENQLFSVVPIFQKFPPLLGMLRLKYRFFMNEDPVRIAPFPFKSLPRMLLVNDFRTIPDGHRLLDGMFNESFDPSRQLFLESNPLPPPMPGKPEGKVAWRDLSTDQVEITADLPKSELLLISDNYSEGWHARALPDSTQGRYQVMPADYFLKAIPLSQGKHHLVLEYRPTIFVIGKWVSIVSCILYVVLLLWDRRNRPFLKKAMS
ncbi:MAG TPA: hypothetical protein VJ873_03280 [bacterium]|nr:hypothetical protein [bacterium]